mgnify:CR=1 FL=1
MLTEKDYCDYETCVALKELGYKGISRFFYATKESPLRRYSYDQILTTRIADAVGHTLAISLYVAQKWLRKEKEIYVTVIPEYNDYRPVKGVKYRLEVAHWKDDEFGYETIEWLDEECPHTIITFDSYEEALSEGIKEAVKILKNNGKDYQV